jgi:hypothetical protein
MLIGIRCPFIRTGENAKKGQFATEFRYQVITYFELGNNRKIKEIRTISDR